MYTMHSITQIKEVDVIMLMYIKIIDNKDKAEIWYNGRWKVIEYQDDKAITHEVANEAEAIELYNTIK